MWTARNAGTRLAWSGAFCFCWSCIPSRKRTKRSLSASSQHVKLQPMKGDSMKTASNEKGRTVVYRRNPGDPLTAGQKANIEKLLANPNRTIDTSDIPEVAAEIG